jgi:phosphoribosyl-AMP cyclohydrolase
VAEAVEPRFGADGLVCAVAQDAHSGAVLMVAWMDREAWERTLADGLATFHSRSRGRLWRKGESSGNVMRVRAIRLDCDRDAVLLVVDPAGPACHTGAPSCFFEAVELPAAGTGEEL